MIHLQKQPERDFIVLNLTDTHLTLDEWQSTHPFSAIFTETVRELIRRNKPDLITLTGDLTMPVPGKEMAYARLADFLESFGIPWAPVWGNHDNENTRDELLRVLEGFSAHRHFLFEEGDPALGLGNYIICVDEGDRTVTGLILVDTHDRVRLDDDTLHAQPVYAKLLPAQLAWYEEQVCALTEKGCLDTMLFMHIPIYAYRLAFAAAFGGDPSSVASAFPSCSALPGTWRHGYEDTVGIQLEDICSHPVDDHVFEVIRRLGSTRHVIAGHDHVNSWMIRYQGVQLIYALKTGPGTYWHPKLNGGTIIRIGHNGVRSVTHDFIDPTRI